MSNLKQAIQAIKSGDRKTGQTLLVEFVKAHPGNEVAWLWLATTVDQAEYKKKCLRQVLKINSENKTAQQSLAKLENVGIEQEMPDVDDIVTAASAGPVSPKTNSVDIQQVEKIFESGKRDYENRDYERAIVKFDQVIANGLEDYRFYYYRGLALHSKDGLNPAQKDYEQALVLSSRAISQHPQEAEAYYWRGRIYTTLNQLDKAISDLSYAIKLRPEFIEAYQAKADAYDRTKQYHQAVEDYSLIINIQPENHKALESRARIYFYHYEEMGGEARTDAIRDFTQLIELKPDQCEYYLKRGELYEKSGERGRAFDDVQQAIKLDDSNWEGYEARAKLLKEMNLLEESLEDIFKACHLARASLTRDPDDNWLEFNVRSLVSNTQFAAHDLAREFEKAEDYTNAFKYVGIALDIEPNATALWWRGRLYKKTGEYHEALADFNQAIQLDPDDASHYIDRAEVYEKLHNYKHAISDYEHVLDISDDAFNLREAEERLEKLERLEELSTRIRITQLDVDAYYHRAELALEELNDYQQAIDDYTILMRLLPNDASDFLFDRGRAFLHNGNYHEAIRDLSQLIKIRSHAGNHYVRAQAYEKMGDISNALADYQQVLRYAQRDQRLSFYLSRTEEKIKILKQNMHNVSSTPPQAQNAPPKRQKTLGEKLRSFFK